MTNKYRRFKQSEFSEQDWKKVFPMIIQKRKIEDEIERLSQERQKLFHKINHRTIKEKTRNRLLANERNKLTSQICRERNNYLKKISPQELIDEVNGNSRRIL